MAVAEITSHDTMSKPIITLMEDAPWRSSDDVDASPVYTSHNLDDDLVSRIEKQGQGSTDASEGRAVTKRVPRKLKFQATVEDVSTPLLSASAFPKPAPASAPLSATTEVIPPEAAPSPRGRGSKPQHHQPSDAPRSSSPLVTTAATHRSDIDLVIKDKPPSSRSRDVPRVHFQDRAVPTPTVPTPTVATTKVHRNPRQNSSRPRAPKETDLSPVDLKWGLLVDGNGQPTKRLENILHGVADYMITQYEPVNSLVITPEKLLRLYKQFNCKQELLPFDCLFDCYDLEEYRDLQCVYAALGCEIHLVSSQPGSPPDIPALTPAGFAKWMSIFMLATPDQEAYRLDSIVERLPIQCKGAGGEIERLPKQLSRHLLPEKHDEQLRVLVLSAYNKAFQRSAIRHAEIESSLVSSSRRSSRSTVYANDRQHRVRRDDSTPRYSREKRMREPDSPERSKRDRSRRAQSRRRKSEYGDNESTATTSHRRRHHHSPGRSPQRSPERSSRRRRTDSSPSHHHRTYSPFSTSSRRHSGSGDDAPRQSSPSSRWTMPLFRGRSSVGGSDDHRRRSRDLTPEDTRQGRRDSEYTMSSSRYPGESRRSSAETSPRSGFEEEPRRSERRRQASVSVY
ncbi:unnamed protein product [Clonostachys solani]|uniref:DUF7514 domain-containing protein n=1 Tax=Clonostachys solani TaxID=160281 RepID=A0A9N9Z7E8_9HYPO|nr:unnamed protein product [Clonostachys solani]